MEVSGRYLVHDGDVVEIEPESFSLLQKCHMFLLNDSLMLATWQPNANKYALSLVLYYYVLCILCTLYTIYTVDCILYTL